MQPLCSVGGIFGTLLTEQDCAGCRLCCKFDSYGLWQTPVICKELASKILQEYLPMARFIRREGHFIMRFEKEAQEDIYPCPLLEPEHGCIMGEEKPFDCMIWPFMLMELEGRRVVTLSPICPVINQRCFDDVCTAALKAAPMIFAYADKHPELVRPYMDEFPVLAVDKAGH